MTEHLSFSAPENTIGHSSAQSGTAEHFPVDVDDLRQKIAGQGYEIAALRKRLECVQEEYDRLHESAKALVRLVTDVRWESGKEFGLNGFGVRVVGCVPQECLRNQEQMEAYIEEFRGVLVERLTAEFGRLFFVRKSEHGSAG